MQKNTDPRTAHAPAQKGPGYETRDVNTRGILYFVIGLFILLVFSLVSMRWLFGYFSVTQPLGPAASPFTNARTLPPAPRLQVQPVVDLDVVRAAQEETLHSYGWVDRANGKVRIPIDRAMDLLVERPLPARPTPPADSQAKSESAGKEQGQ
jgi:hypothetical protein